MEFFQRNIQEEHERSRKDDCTFVFLGELREKNYFK